MEAPRPSETLSYRNTTRRHNPEDSEWNSLTLFVLDESETKLSNFGRKSLEK
jgi:hypothetical protein